MRIVLNAFIAVPFLSEYLEIWAKNKTTKNEKDMMLTEKNRSLAFNNLLGFGLEYERYPDYKRFYLVFFGMEFLCDEWTYPDYIPEPEETEIAS